MSTILDLKKHLSPPQAPFAKRQNTRPGSLRFQLRIRVSVAHVREPVSKVFDIKILAPRLLQRLEIVQPATRPDSRNGGRASSRS